MAKKSKAQQSEPVQETVETAAEAEVTETVNEEPTAQQWQEALELAVSQRNALAKERDDLKDSYLRAQADFQNFKRRNQTARADGYEEGVREAIASVLPAIDNMERALDAANKQGVSDGLVEGVQLTLTTLLTALEKMGLEEIPAMGEDFDPELHNAVMREAGDTPGKILDVFQKGYRVKDKIIRYAMVKVCAD